MFALLFYVGAILVDDGSVEYEDFFTAMFAVIFGAFGVGQVMLLVVFSHPVLHQGICFCVLGHVLGGRCDHILG